MLWQIAALAVLGLLALAYRRLEKVAPTPQDLMRLREASPLVAWLLEQRIDETFWRYRHFGFRLMAVLYLPLRQDLKRLCRGSWRLRGLLITFDGLYPLLWLKGIVFGDPRDLRVILGLHLLAAKRIKSAP